MKKSFSILMVAILLMTYGQYVFAGGATFSIEDKDLRGVKKSIFELIEADSSFIPFRGLNCSLVGKHVPLSETEKFNFSLITTSDACGWGASIGPIWIVGEYGDSPKILVYSGGYFIKILHHVKNGMSDISLNSEARNLIYQFNGKKYVRKRK